MRYLGIGIMALGLVGCLTGGDKAGSDVDFQFNGQYVSRDGMQTLRIDYPNFSVASNYKDSANNLFEKVKSPVQFKGVVDSQWVDLDSLNYIHLQIKSISVTMENGSQQARTLSSILSKTEFQEAPGDSTQFGARVHLNDTACLFGIRVLIKE